MESVSDNIELILPFKGEYVSVARLVASDVGNRIGFDIEAIEDIKVAISEVCSKLVSIGSEKANNYKIVYSISKGCLKVTYLCDDPSIKCVFKNESDSLAIHLINALMDEVELCTDRHVLSMSKVLERDA